MENKKIYIVEKSEGQYDDHDIIILKCFLDEKLADKFKYELEKKLEDYKKTDEYVNYSDDDDDNDDMKTEYNYEVWNRVYNADRINGYHISSYDIEDFYYTNRENNINKLI